MTDHTARMQAANALKVLGSAMYGSCTGAVIHLLLQSSGQTSCIRAAMRASLSLWRQMNRTVPTFLISNPSRQGLHRLTRPLNFSNVSTKSTSGSAIHSSLDETTQQQQDDHPKSLLNRVEEFEDQHEGGEDEMETEAPARSPSALASRSVRGSVLTGGLYLVATPIGNLEDITLRALTVLQGCSLVLAEDTRHTRKLLSRHSISTETMSYHAHNEREREAFLVQRLLGGEVSGTRQHHCFAREGALQYCTAHNVLCLSNYGLRKGRFSCVYTEQLCIPVRMCYHGRSLLRST